MSRTIALIACFVFGMIMFGQYFSDHEIAHQINQTVLEYWQIIFAFTLLIGVISYLKNSIKDMRKPENRPYRLVSLAGLFIMPIFAIIWGIKADTPFMWMFENVQAPMQATVFSLLAFFVASASFRGFRARSLPAIILLSSAALILLSRSALGGILWDQIPEFADWIRKYPSMSARRAILIGIGLGSLTTSLRVILGIERTWLGGSK
ncbi:MAG: hypothetical protein DRP35_10215 [Candidatus Zixiibacteriota bacterium]|nr:MAG: hypothetical protein DRP35_10215 [candidate division Zixibacteria bacterium]